MPQPRHKWNEFLGSARHLLTGLDTPQYKAEALREDLDPQSMHQLTQALGDRRHQNPVAQQALMDEKQRLEQVQAQYVQQMAQQFPQRLAAGLDLGQRTGQPTLTQTPEAFMAKLMLQMQRRSGMPRQQVGAPEQAGPIMAQGDY